MPVPFMDLLRFLPLSYVSWFLGILANLPLPQPLARWTIEIFISAYGIDPTDATKPVSSFNSIGEFFTRDLRPELRPMGNGLVSPVDGTLRDQVDLSPGIQIPQVKGKNYNLSELLGEDPLVERLENGRLWNLYLSPKDAHHIHAPFAGRIVKTTRIPGKLWPVNDWALNSIDRLFAVNERVITFIETEQGLLAVVMVGATNVGRISLSYMELETNLRPWERKIKQSTRHESAITVKPGQKIGTFKMGSSVILISERQTDTSRDRNLPCSVKYGESL